MPKNLVREDISIGANYAAHFESRNHSLKQPAAPQWAQDLMNDIATPALASGDPVTVIQTISTITERAKTAFTADQGLSELMVYMMAGVINTENALTWLMYLSKNPLNFLGKQAADLTDKVQATRDDRLTVLTYNRQPQQLAKSQSRVDLITIDAPSVEFSMGLNTLITAKHFVQMMLAELRWGRNGIDALTHIFRPGDTISSDNGTTHFAANYQRAVTKQQEPQLKIVRGGTEVLEQNLMALLTMK